MTETPKIDNSENVQKCKQSIIQFIEAMPDDEFTRLVAAPFIDGVLGSIFSPLSDSLKKVLGVESNVFEGLKSQQERRYKR